MKVIQLFRNESQLIKSAAKNNREAQRRLYERHSGKMLSICRQYVKDLQYAEEVMLTGFFKVFTHLQDFKGEGSFEGWMRKIMIREAISFLRTQKKVEFCDENIEENGGSTDPVTSEFSAAHIQEMIDNLPEGYKMVFLLYAVEGYKHSEIAKMLKISEGTSKSQLFKARKMLKEKLELEKNTAYDTGKF
ncbi:RNA polymerase sigma factor [Salinimicrobium flavum]|uniref:RNA polymerase sigma factor n=1 Tax=Salinimicrobium flavum TaxID=1737065 RepID=A0ABW5IS20_9FLAO